VLGYPAINVPGDADIERASAAGQDIDPEFVIEAVAHGRRVSQAVWVELPDAAWLQKAFSRSFDYAPFSNGVNSRVDALRSG
jgi:hypothetical protein